MTYLWLGGAWLSILWPLFAVVWSIAVPNRRIWPCGKTTLIKILIIWMPALLFILSIFMLGLADWNHFGWPDWLRWGVGLPLLIIGHIIVYSGVFKIGYQATSGAASGLKTDGLYAYSRNPQYSADIAILTGWIILSASMTVLPLALTGIALLILAPFSEEPWLREVYGNPYIDYCKRVRRFL
ncbi:MAG: isoprenylcysteine carboxylmethyltransferase family protein [Robiginitomaculum sp.]|nr:isoprenylcysteine carboxylmethyltransferase family protein [Robiginitomaculum sp.]